MKEITVWVVARFVVTAEIEKLDEKSYDSWCVQMLSVLVHSELWIVSSGQLKQESSPEAVNWQGLDQKALATLILIVRPSQLGYVKHCSHAAEAWTSLSEVHQPSGPVRKISIYKKLLRPWSFRKRRCKRQWGV